MKRSGFTLIEVLVSSILTALIVMSLSIAFSIAVHHQQNFNASRSRFEKISFFEDEVRRLLTKATLAPDQPEAAYFVADSTSGDSSVSDRLTFTVLGRKPSSVAVDNEDQDFANRNQEIGPVGGTTEIGLSMTAVGDPGGAQGLYLRRQTPADTNTESGGLESVLDSDVASFEFEFWDSTAWVATWDSRTENRLPTAVRVHYTLESDPDVQRSFVVQLPNAQEPEEGTGVATG